MITSHQSCTQCGLRLCPLYQSAVHPTPTLGFKDERLKARLYRACPTVHPPEEKAACCSLRLASRRVQICFQRVVCIYATLGDNHCFSSYRSYHCNGQSCLVGIVLGSKLFQLVLFRFKRVVESIVLLFFCDEIARDLTHTTS